jgi:hypothetical protein
VRILMVSLQNLCLGIRYQLVGIVDQKMSEFKRLPKPEMRSYGNRRDVRIETEARDIQTTIYMPEHPARATRAYIQLNGLTANRFSMHLPARLAAERGNVAITFDYRSNSMAPGAIDRNVRDCTEVVTATRNMFDDLTICLLGLSMGGEVAIKTAARGDVQAAMRPGGVGVRPSVTAVAAAGLTKEGIPLPEGIRRVASFSSESGRLLVNHLTDTLGLAQACGAHTVRRSLGVIGEIRDITGGVNARREAVMAASGIAQPFMRTFNGNYDGLIPRIPQERGISDLPFDEREWYNGRHCDLAFDPSIASSIYGSDIDYDLYPSSSELVAA